MKYIKSSLFLIKYIVKNFKSYYPVGLMLVLLGVANTWVSVISLRLLLDALSKADYDTAIRITIAFPLIAAALNIVSNDVQRRQSTKSKLISAALKADLAGKQMQFPQDLLERQDIREQYHFAKKCSEEEVIGSLLSASVVLVSTVINIVGSVVLFAVLNVYVMLLLLVLAAASTVGTIMRMQYKFEQQEDESPIEMNMYYARDYLTGPVFAKEVRAYDLRGFICSKIVYWIEKHFLLECSVSKRFFKKFWWTYVVNFVQLAVTYTYIGLLLAQKTITVSEFSTYIAAILVFTGSVSGMLSSAAGIFQNAKYIHHLKTFLLYDDANAAGDRITIPKNREIEIVFSDVSFRYSEDGPWILKDINLTVRPHEKICIVGVNGAGKTTLVNLLMGFYKPSKGHIYFNGQDISHCRRSDCLGLFGTVFQEFNIFDFSIEENIKMGLSESHVSVPTAIQEAGLSGVISKLKDGEKTYITQRVDRNGIDLSGGERQLLAIARALYKNAPIYVLDEPTAALSPQNEYALYQKFDEITQGQTVFFISHRLNSCRLADRIVLLNDNTVAEIGSHDELMNMQGIYFKMFSAQAGYYQSADNFETDKDFEGGAEDEENA